MDLRAGCEQEIRKQLRVQTEIQADHLRDSIKLREMEIEKAHRRELGKVLTEESTKYQLMLAALLGRMRGIHQGLQGESWTQTRVSSSQVLKVFFVLMRVFFKHFFFRLCPSWQVSSRSSGPLDSMSNIVPQCSVIHWNAASSKWSKIDSKNGW